MPAAARRTASSLSERRTTEPVTISSSRAAGVDQDQDAAVGRGQRGVQPLRVGVRLAVGGADVDGELEAAGGLGAADRPVDLGQLGRGEGSPPATGAPGARRARLELLGGDLVGGAMPLVGPPNHSASPRHDWPGW